jgi:hypothetical protein
MALKVASGNSSCTASLPWGSRAVRMPGTVASALHFRARLRRRLGAVEQEDRNYRSPRQIEISEQTVCHLAPDHVV